MFSSFPALTNSELETLMSNSGPQTFRRRHVIDTGNGHLVVEQIKRYGSPIEQWKRDEAGKLVRVI